MIDLVQLPWLQLVSKVLGRGQLGVLPHDEVVVVSHGLGVLLLKVKLQIAVGLCFIWRSAMQMRVHGVVVRFDHSLHRSCPVFGLFLGQNAREGWANGSDRRI
jgi:hypothetical protein